jgi:hypothetical protein
MSLLCRFFNLPKGCQPKKGVVCGFRHEKYCDVPGCKNPQNHITDECGKFDIRLAKAELPQRQAHLDFIAEKRVKSMAEKAKKKAAEAAKPEASAPDPSTALEKAKHTLGDAVYKKALSILKNNDSEGYNKVMEEFPLDLTAERLTGKIVGMLLEGLEFDELFKLATSPSTEELEEYMAHATDVLYKHAKEVAE